MKSTPELKPKMKANIKLSEHTEIEAEPEAMININHLTKHQDWAIGVKVLKIQGSVPVEFYLSYEDLPHNSVSFSHTDSNPELNLNFHKQNLKPIWTGHGTYSLPITPNHEVNLAQLIQNYAVDILNSACQFTDDNFDISVIKPEFIQLKITENITIHADSDIIRIHGLIWSHTATSKLSEYAVEFEFILHKLASTPMIGRVGDSRIGYFYDQDAVNSEHNTISGEIITIINRMNLDTAPWIFYIAETIPTQYHSEVARGVLSWNAYFKHLNLGEPFQVKILNKDNKNPNQNPKWVITGTELDDFNGPYSGYSSSINDYRSGENLLGIISLNLIKIASNPSRYYYMNGLPHKTDTVAGFIDKYIAWVTAHEVGHQLGFRHNFLGNTTNNGLGSIMDYIDIFTDFNHIETLDISDDNLRDYDLKAVEYGYVRLDNEKSGIKHPSLDKILDDADYRGSFATDENNEEQVNPDVGLTENQEDTLEFLRSTVIRFGEYRKNLLKQIQAKQITPLDYNTMFIYLYTYKYAELIQTAMRFIGGRRFSHDRHQFIELDKKSIYQAIEFLLNVLIEIQYSPDEYSHIIYDFESIQGYQKFNRVQMPTIYSMNSTNMMYLYYDLLHQIFTGLTNPDHIMRLKQSSLSPREVLMKFTTVLFQGLPNNKYQNERQLRWVRHLLNCQYNSKYVIIHEDLQVVIQSIQTLILPLKGAHYDFLRQLIDNATKNSKIDLTDLEIEN
jgi:hypothetical protein